MEPLKIVVSENQDGTSSCEDFKILTQLSPAEMRAKCIDKPWNWITKNPYLAKTLLEEAVVIDPQTGKLPEKSGDYTIDLAFGLCVSGHYNTESKAITINDTAIVFDPWE